MKWCALVLAVVVSAASCAGAPAAGTPPATAKSPSPTVIGCLVHIENLVSPDEQWSALELRVDQPAEGQIAAGEVLSLRCARSKLRGIGLGDEVKAALGPAAENGERRAVEEITRLGRGEFLNPAKKATEDLGSPDAKVLVKMFAPLKISCHQATVDLLRKLVEEEPNRLRVQLFDFHDRDAVAEVNRERLSCATVLVNNRYRFVIEKNGKKRHVAFTHRPNTEKSSYNSEDVPVVVRAEIARVYGAKKPSKPQATEKPAEQEK